MSEKPRKKRSIALTTARHEKALAVLLRGASVRAAARELGCSERSVYRLMRDPEFSREYQQRQRDLFDHSVSWLLSASSMGVEYLVSNLKSNNQSAETRRTAVAIIQLAFRGMEFRDLNERIEMLEELNKKLVEAVNELQKSAR